MATKNDKPKVTRISASDDSLSAKKTVTKKQPSKKAKAEAKRTAVVKARGPLAKFFGYFKGAWTELRQVRWPTRRATWGLTGAVLIFSLFFVIFITSLDALFKFLFEQILR